MVKYSQQLKSNLNKDITEHFPHIIPINKTMKITRSGVARMVMLERYSQKDEKLLTLRVGDFVLVTIKDDIKFPTLGTGIVIKIIKHHVLVEIDDEYRHQISSEFKQSLPGQIKVLNHFVHKPLELYYEQIATRVALTIGNNENPYWKEKFTHEIISGNIVPAGRILFGAGSNSQVTFFNCFVLPMIHDSKDGIAKHRQELAKIMSHGGGVGSNGSTLRPRHAYVAGTNGKSSGAVSWLNDLSTLTDLIQQGGSRRGAQMIMLQVWHPDIIEFIISKMQKPNILQWIFQNFKDEIIKEEAHRKLRFVPLTPFKKAAYQAIKDLDQSSSKASSSVFNKASQLLEMGGEYEISSAQFLSGANISVGITDDFMDAVKNDLDWDLRFPDLQKMNAAQKLFYDQNWQEMGDVREWEDLGYPVKTYHTIRAQELWHLINFCATYSAEPGVFFIDVANKMTNAVAYDQKVVSTNPCGEQPLTPYSVCNLSAINLTNFVDKKAQQILWSQLEESVKTCVRFQDNIIDETPYFMKENEEQAKKERRIGMGVMGLHDMLIWLGIKYGSEAGNKIIDRLFKTIATTAYKTSAYLAEEKGSFPYLYDVEKLLNSGYLLIMPESIRKLIRQKGLRNSHLLTIAPTGSTGTMLSVSTGLEPYFAFKFYRSGRLGKFLEVDQKIVADWKKLHNYTKNELPTFFNNAMELTPEEHLNVQITIQRWVDSSISKTVNAPKGYSVQQVEKIYMSLYERGAKGGTVYVDGSRDAQVLTLSKNFEQEDDESILPNVLMTDSSKASVARVQERHADIPGLVANRRIGNEIGDICPVCKIGTIENFGGCHSCSNCNAQLKCGL